MQIRQLIFAFRTPVLVAGLLLAGSFAGLQANPSPNLQFTVEVLSPNTATSTLVASNATWRYFKGTGNPNAGWDTANESFLGPTWGTGTGGFGFGDGDDQTHLSDMQNRYSTIYLVTKFTYPRVLDPRRLKLRIDYDDGFVAYLDGKEFARANAPGEPGAWPSSASLATASHEAARGDGGHPLETYYFAPNFPALFPHANEDGDLLSHRLAIQGFNRTLADDDFSMIASLELEKLFTEVSESSVQLAGRVNLLGAAEVFVNDSPATLDSAGGVWAKTHPLRPGLNRLVIQARDCDGHVLASLSKDILHKGTPRLVGGVLSSDASWNSTNGVIELTDVVTVGEGVTLTIAEGTTVLFRPGTQLLTYGGTINVSAASNSPAFLLPADGETPWDGISLYGSDSSLTVKFAEIVAGKIKLFDHASASLEDTVVRDYSYTADGLHDYLLHAMNYCVLTARRSVFSRYYTMAFGGQSKLQFDDCLFDSAEHDFFKPQDTPPDSYARRCTFARSSVAGTDGVDTSANATFTIDNCLFYEIPDKVGSSRVDLQACKLEYSIVSPK